MVSQRSGSEKDGVTHEQRAAPEVLHAWQLLGDHFFSRCCRRIVALLTLRDSSICVIFTHSLRRSSFDFITAQCALWEVRWPYSNLTIGVKTLSHGKTILLRLFFLCSFRKKT